MRPAPLPLYRERMDLEAALTLATAAAGGAATAAGQSAWQSLLALARRATGREPAGQAAGVEPAGTADPVGSVDPEDGEAVRVLIGRIAERARADEDFAGELRHWAETHRAVIQLDRSHRSDDSQVHNTVSGNAKIEGTVVQARDIHGGINL